LDKARAYLDGGLPIAALEELARTGPTVAGDPAARASVLMAAAEAWAALHRDAEGLAALRAAGGPEADAELPVHMRRRLRADLALAYGRVGRFDLALEAARAALELAGPEPDPLLRPRLNLTLSGVHIARGEWLPAEAAARRAMQAFDRDGAGGGAEAGAGLARALHNLGVVAAQTDRLLAARRHLERACEIDAALGTPGSLYHLARHHAELAWVYLRLNDAAVAVRHGSLALEALWDCVGYADKAELARVSHLFGGIYRAAGDRDRAVACLNRAAAYYAQSGRLPEWQRAAADLNEVLSPKEPPPVRGSRGYPVPTRDRARAQYLVMLLTLGDSLASVHPQLDGRAEVVTAYALALARALGLGEEQRAVLGHAGRLQDIGLTLCDADDDRAERLHPSAGAEILRSFPLPPGCLEAVRHHHERWDGGGYPDGLRGVRIPTAARVLAVADAYVARALWDRGGIAPGSAPGLPPARHRAALAALRAEAGRSFDPDVVAALEAVHRRAAAGPRPLPPQGAASYTQVDVD
jgi:tetratricopeptide (TPR) repeat protein